MHTANLLGRHSCPRHGAVLSVLFCLLISGFAFSQATSSTTGFGSSAPSPTEPGGIDINFRGGSALAYLEAIGAAAKFEGFVIHQREMLAELTLPVVTLRGADVATAVEVLTHSRYDLPDGAIAAVEARWVGPAGELQDKSFGPSHSEADLIARSACIITVETDRRSVPKVVVVRAVRTVFDLSPLEGANTADIQTLLDAVTIAIEMDGTSPSFQAKYHEPSHLLIVRGTPDEMTLVREIIAVRVPRLSEHAAADPRPTEKPVRAEVPPALTDDELKGLKPQELYEHLANIARARKNPDLDAATSSRLQHDMQKVLARLKNAS